MADPKKNLLETLEKIPMTHLKTPTNSSTSSSIQPVILSTVKVCKSPAEVLSLVSGMIQEKLLLEDDNTTALNTQLKFYFDEVGIDTESSFALMKEKSLWPLPSDISSIETGEDDMNTSAATDTNDFADIADLKLGEDEYKTMDISVSLDEDLKYEDLMHEIDNPPKATVATAQQTKDLTSKASHFNRRQLKQSP